MRLPCLGYPELALDEPLYSLEYKSYRYGLNLLDLPRTLLIGLALAEGIKVDTFNLWADENTSQPVVIRDRRRKRAMSLTIGELVERMRSCDDELSSWIAGRLPSQKPPDAQRHVMSRTWQEADVVRALQDLTAT